MAETMIERCARAVHTASGARMPWEQEHPGYQEVCRQFARSVITEMRKPPRNIVTAFVDGETDVETATARWNAAIDAALSEGGE